MKQYEKQQRVSSCLWARSSSDYCPLETACGSLPPTMERIYQNGTNQNKPQENKTTVQKDTEQATKDQ